MSVRLGLRHLSIIEAISLTESFSEAAASVNISSSAFSHRLREAERRLGVQLAKKRDGRTYLTTAGNILLTAAQTCLRELERAETEIKLLGLRDVEFLKIGASSLFGFQDYGAFLTLLAKEQPEIEALFISSVSSDPITALKSRVIDLAIMPSKIELPVLEATQISSDEMVAALSVHHRKAHQPYLTAKDFINETYIGFSPGREQGREFESFFEPAGISPGKVICAGSTENMLMLTKTGMGISIFARDVITALTDLKDIKLLPLTKTGLRFHWYVISRKQDSELSPSKKILALLQKKGWPKSSLKKKGPLQRISKQ